MSGKRKSTKKKTARRKPEGLIDRRDFATQVTSGVVTALVVEGLQVLRAPGPKTAKIIPAAGRAAGTSQVRASATLVAPAAKAIAGMRAPKVTVT